MEIIAKVKLSSPPSNIIELKNGNYAFSVKKNTIIMNNHSFVIKEELKNHSDEINRIIETKNGHLITISSDKTIAINELDENNNYRLLQRINEPKKINSIIELSTNELLTCNCDDKIRIYKYNTENKKYELDNTEKLEHLPTHCFEVKNGKILILTFDGKGNQLRLFCYDIQKRKIEKMLNSHISIFWNNHESIFNISDKLLGIILCESIIILDKENISIIQEIQTKSLVEGLSKFINYSIIFTTIDRKIYLLESNEDGIWSYKQKTDDVNFDNEKISTFFKTSNGQFIMGTQDGIKIFKLLNN